MRRYWLFVGIRISDYQNYLDQLLYPLLRGLMPDPAGLVLLDNRRQGIPQVDHILCRNRRQSHNDILSAKIRRLRFNLRVLPVRSRCTRGAGRAADYSSRHSGYQVAAPMVPVPAQDILQGLKLQTRGRPPCRVGKFRFAHAERTRVQPAPKGQVAHPAVCPTKQQE